MVVVSLLIIFVLWKAMSLGKVEGKGHSAFSVWPRCVIVNMAK